MKEVYSLRWPLFRNKYGFMRYERVICDELISLCPSKGRILDIGIGIGYPFAQTFKEKFEVYGLDISQFFSEFDLRQAA